jgi:alpha 1,2-mannosyltransferase
VLLAGGPVYTLNAYLNCRLLRNLGCTLPIEWHHLGPEIPVTWLPRIRACNVRLNDLGGDGSNQTKHRGGWQNKVNAILASEFDDILWLDADCFPLRDPSYLFDHEFFTSTGAVLWPDPHCWSNEHRHYLAERYGVWVPRRQVESGQMMFRKEVALPGLLKTRDLNENADVTYQDMYGDKDTFLIGALQAESPWRVVRHLHDRMTRGMRHKDFNGQPLFAHLAGGKWRLHGRPFVTRQDYPLLDDALNVLKDLRSEGLLCA